MAENKKSFVGYADWGDTFEMLEDAEAGKLIKHFFRYINDKNPELDDKLLKVAFNPIKLQLKRDLKEWEATKTKKSESGALGNLKRWNPELYEQVINGKLTLDTANIIAKNRTAIGSDVSPSQQVAKVAVNVNVNDTVTDNVNDTVINNKAIALVASDTSDERQLKKEYSEIAETFEAIDAKERWIKVRDFIRDKKPAFIEPYFDAWNIFSINIQLSKEPQKITDKRRKKFATRIREPDFKNRFLEILEKIKTSAFAKGDNNRGWKVGIEFILDSQENYSKILENRYDF